MTPNTTTHPDVTRSMRSWRRRAPWYRRLSASLGLQGKLTIGFMFLMSVALGGSCWFFMTESREATERVVRQQATAISHTLAMASETPLAEGNVPELQRVGTDLLKNKGVVATAFYDATGRLLSVASQDADLSWNDLDAPPHDAGGRRMLRVQKMESAALGRYLEVTASVTPLSRRPTKPTTTTTNVIGYVRVCFSQAHDEAHLTRATQMLVLIGATVSLVCFPLVYGLIHRIFLPIRELVDATDRITAGDLDTQVAIHRSDVIGTLARSFNDMVVRVRQQQQDLETANRKLAEANASLERANADLEEKVVQRTDQLETANRRLKSEIAEKEDFLRAVSHDLNAPLRNISGMATMLLMKYRDRFDEDVVHRLERIQKNVEVETDLITELLELSRIKTRRQKSEPVEVATMISELGELFENDLREREISLAAETPFPLLFCERARLRQVFQNLVDNAIKYMGQGSPQSDGAAPVREIRVGCVVRRDEAEFYVRDTGIGIEPEDLDKVFYVFRRGRSAAVQAVSGKGVGLASVKSIVETYNGTIWVNSELGRGSTFRFTINGQYMLAAAPAEQGRAA